MNRAAIASTALLLLLAGCGGNTAAPATKPSSTGSEPSGASASSTPTPTPTAPVYASLSKADLTGALLSIQDLPAGYSQDPPSKPSPDKTFCDYKQPFRPTVSVRRDFTKGAGLSTQFISIGLRQYRNAEQARASFEALVKALNRCHGETYEGSKLTYALMSTPKVGDDAVGVRITSDSGTGLQNFALVGPTLVNTGAGGIVDVNADVVARLHIEQVHNYETAASN